MTVGFASLLLLLETAGGFNDRITSVSKFLTLGLFLLLLRLHAAGAAHTRQAAASPPPPPRAQQNSQPAEDPLARHLSAAQTYQLSGDLERAAVENRAVIAIVLSRLGSLAMREREQLQRATQLLSASLALREDARTRTDLSIARMRLLDIDGAVAEAQAALRSDEKNARAHHVLGKLFYIKKNYPDAARELERAVVLEADLDAAFALGMTYLRLKQLERAKLLFEEMQAALKDSAHAHLLFGRAYEETGFSAEAEREFRRALAIDPQAPRARFYLGYVILIHGGAERQAEAAAEFELELKLNPQDFYSRYFLGALAAVSNDHRAAVTHLLVAARLKPDSGETHLRLGLSQAELGDAAAEQSLRRAIELTTDVSQNGYQIKQAHFLLGRLLIKAGRRAEGEKQLAVARELQARSLEISRQEVGDILGGTANPMSATNPANELIVSGQPGARVNQEAGTGVEETLLIEDSASDTRGAETRQALKARLSEVAARAYHNLGVIAAQQGRLAESAASFAAAAEWQPGLAGLDRNWGIVSFRAEQYDKAIPPLARHLQTQPTDALARRMLGVSHYLTGNFRLAADTLKPLEPAITDDLELGYAYGVSLARLADVKAATLLFTRLAARRPPTPQAHLYAAQGLMMLADYEGALREYRAAAGLDASLRQAHHNAGLSLIRLNRLDEAEGEFRQELRLNPADETSKYYLAYVLLEQKQKTDEALTLLKEAIAARPDYADARYRLGKTLAERGDVAGAIEQLEAAARSEPAKDYIRYQLSIAYRRAARATDADRELRLYKELKAASRESSSPAGAMGDKRNAP